MIRCSRCRTSRGAGRRRDGVARAGLTAMARYQLDRTEPARFHRDRRRGGPSRQSSRFAQLARLEWAHRLPRTESTRTIRRSGPRAVPPSGDGSRTDRRVDGGWGRGTVRRGGRDHRVRDHRQRDDGRRAHPRPQPHRRRRGRGARRPGCHEHRLGPRLRRGRTRVAPRRRHGWPPTATTSTCSPIRTSTWWSSRRPTSPMPPCSPTRSPATSTCSSRSRCARRSRTA